MRKPPDEVMEAVTKPSGLGLGAGKTLPANPCPSGSYHRSRRCQDEGDRGSSEQSAEEVLEKGAGALAAGLIGRQQGLCSVLTGSYLRFSAEECHGQILVPRHTDTPVLKLRI